MGGGEEEHFEDFGENHGAELLEGGVEDQEEAPAEEGGPGALHTPEQINCSSLIMSPRYRSIYIWTCAYTGLYVNVMLLLV